MILVPRLEAGHECFLITWLTRGKGVKVLQGDSKSPGRGTTAKGIAPTEGDRFGVP